MNPKKPRNKCKNCGKECKTPAQVYCCQQCQCDFQYHAYIEKWLKKEVTGNREKESISGYVKRFMRERSNNKCEKCGWGKENPYDHIIYLQIHHKDGDYNNSYVDNLEYICPNCHTLTSHYGNLNRGNGRYNRRMNERKHYND